jgi:two-component system response regulator LytT
VYSIILVEDDSMQRKVLKKMILSMHDFVRIYEADSEDSALDIIQKHDINLFLIDISLKESSGLNLALNIRNIPKYEFRQIIFLTTHMEYITQAFKQTHCYDYIIKPYDKEDVQAMLNRIILNETNSLNVENDSPKADDDREFVITLKNGIYVGIKIKDILFIEVKGKNCQVYTINGMYIAINTTLKKILKLINCDCIIQSHRAFAVNKKYIYKIEKLDSRLGEVQFENYPGTALLGYKFRDNVISEFKKGKVVIC